MILISDPRVLKIKIKDNKDPLVDARQFGIKVDGRKAKDSPSYFMVRKSVVEKLSLAQKLLPNDLSLLLIEGFRPIALQKQYFNEYYKELLQSYPTWSKKKLLTETSKFVAPPEIIPPHCTGGAIDITLVDSNGIELDMGTVVNADPNSNQNTCFTHSKKIDEKTQNNRSILINTMEKVGFVNYPTEWWHWSYGDRYWAYLTGNKVALFDKTK